MTGNEKKKKEDDEENVEIACEQHSFLNKGEIWFVCFFGREEKFLDLVRLSQRFQKTTLN